MILSNYWKAIPQFAPMNGHHADKFIESVQYERSAFVQIVWDKSGRNFRIRWARNWKVYRVCSTTHGTYRGTILALEWKRTDARRFDIVVVLWYTRIQLDTTLIGVDHSSHEKMRILS